MQDQPNRYIVSTPRSGSNWVRFCIEEFCGVPTPGKKLLFDSVDRTGETIVRLHDPGNARRRIINRNDAIWKRIPHAETSEGIVALLIRDPLESFVRMAKMKWGRFRVYTGNIEYFVASPAKRKRVFYYDDIVQDSSAIAELLTFLDLPVRDGYPGPTPANIAERWDAAREKSLSLYDVNQSKGGGAHTRHDSLDFSYHQRKLSDAHKAEVWRHLDLKLSDEALSIIGRYRPGGDFGRATLRDRLRLLG